MNSKIIYVLVALSAFVVLVKCDQSEKEIFNMIDKLDNEESLHLFGGLCLNKIENIPKSFPSEHETVVDRVSRYLDSHEIKFDIDDNVSNDVGGKCYNNIYNNILFRN